MIEIVDSIIDVIKRHVINSQHLLGNHAKGSTILQVWKNTLYVGGAQVALYDEDKLEIVTVKQKINPSQIEICNPLANDWEDSTSTQLLHDGQFIQYVLAGNPPSCPSYPAITVELLGNENEPLTLGMFTQEHELRITVWANQNTYDASYRLIRKLATKIEGSLFRTVYPTVYPFCTLALEEDIAQDSHLMKLAETPQLYPPQSIEVIHKSTGNRWPNHISESLGHGVYNLYFPAPHDFEKEKHDLLVPTTWIYDALCNSVRYSDGNDGDTLLLNATIDYKIKIARIRIKEVWQ